MTETLPTILLTRPAAQSADFAARLRARLGPEIPILVSPILEITPVPFDLTVVPRFVILTSAHAAGAAARAGLAGLPAWCVGDRTAEAAAEAGLLPHSAAGDAGALLSLLLAARPDGPGLYLHGRHAASDIAGALVSSGIDTYSVIAYDQLPRPLSPDARAAVDRRSPVFLPVFSPRSAHVLAAEVRGAEAPLHLIAISANTAAAWKDSAASVSIAAAPDGPSMEDAVVAEVRARSAC